MLFALSLTASVALGSLSLLLSCQILPSHLLLFPSACCNGSMCLPHIVLIETRLAFVLPYCAPYCIMLCYTSFPQLSPATHATSAALPVVAVRSTRPSVPTRLAAPLPTPSSATSAFALSALAVATRSGALSVSIAAASLGALRVRSTLFIFLDFFSLVFLFLSRCLQDPCPRCCVQL